MAARRLQIQIAAQFKFEAAVVAQLLLGNQGYVLIL